MNTNLVDKSYNVAGNSDSSMLEVKKLGTTKPQKYPAMILMRAVVRGPYGPPVFSARGPYSETICNFSG